MDYEPDLTNQELRVLRSLPDFQVALLADRQARWDEDVRLFGRDAIYTERPQ